MGRLGCLIDPHIPELELPHNLPDWLPRDRVAAASPVRMGAAVNLPPLADSEVLRELQAQLDSATRLLNVALELGRIKEPQPDVVVNPCRLLDQALSDPQPLRQFKQALLAALTWSRDQLRDVRDNKLQLFGCRAHRRLHRDIDELLGLRPPTL